MRPILSFLFFIALLIGCNNSTEKNNDCPLGQPTPIFADTLSQVQSQQFELNGQESLETVVFKNGISLELAQSGCEQIAQEFSLN